MEIKTGIYKHFKGGTVLVYGTEIFSEDKSTLVKYIGLQDRKFYSRPADDFCGFKEIDGKQVPRFALVKSIEIDLSNFLSQIIEENKADVQF